MELISAIQTWRFLLRTHARTHGQQTSTYGPRSGTAADVQPAERLSSFWDGEMTDHVLQSAPKSFTLSPCNL